MEDIDAKLHANNIPIHARSLHAALEYSKRFGMEIPITPSSTPAIPNDYTGAHVAAHIFHWCDERYGNRQKIFMGPGTTIIVLRGDPWELRLPLIYGTVQCVVERDLSRYAQEPQIRTDGKRSIINLITLLNEFPAGLAKQLTDEECRNLLDSFRHALDCMQALQYISANPFIPEALSDIKAAVRHILSVPPHFGQSKWSSAQAAEKLLKSFLKAKAVDFPFSHDIKELTRLTTAAGMKPIDSAITVTLQTTPKVRYGDVPVSMKEAVAAHHGSLVVAKQVSDAIRAP